MHPHRAVALIAALAGGCGSSEDAPAAGACNDDSGVCSPADANYRADAAVFTDPNPMPCVGLNAPAICRNGFSDPSGGQVPPFGCCLTDLPNEPDGKCGLSAAGRGPCTERKAPGNLDANCAFGHWSVPWGGFNIVGSGMGCCMWRSGQCGVVSRDFGCVELGEVYLRRPCTPDFAEGIGEAD